MLIADPFTIIQANEQFWILIKNNGNRRSLTSAYLLYGHLVHLWNGCGRPASFKRQTNLICAECCISKPTLERQRQILKNSGLIDFYSKGKGDPNITYVIKNLGLIPGSKNSLLPDEKLKNFTSSVTSPVTSADDIKQSIEKELFIVVKEEVKNFNYLKELFEADEGLKMKWRGNGYPPEKFSDGVEQWMMQVNGQEYHDFQKARNHFFFWLPNYAKPQKEKNGSKTNQRTAAAATDQSPGDSNYAGGF